MSRLTVLEGLPVPDPERVGPHAYRRLAGRILITNDWGGRAWLTEEEYRRFLSGIGREDSLWPLLQPQGFLRNALDFDAAAQDVSERGLPVWKGPSTHLVFLQRGGETMDLETARRCLDFAFSAPGRQVTVELAADDAEAVWPVLWFCVQYSRRRAEWARRPLFLIVRSRGGLEAERVEFLRGHGAARRLVLDVSAAPDLSAQPVFRAQRALCLVGPKAKDPAGWADLLMGWGLDSVLLRPERSLLRAGGMNAFLAFYEGFLGRLIERAEEQGPAEEWVLAFLGRAAWNLPGTDILEELAYSPRGGVHTSEEGLALAEEGADAFFLGESGALRYEDIGKSAVARACVSAVQADNQPLCFQCAYKPYCAVPASLNVSLQGSVWGDLSASPACSLNMGLMDLVFSRWDDGKTLHLFAKWGVDIIR